MSTVLRTKSFNSKFFMRVSKTTQDNWRVKPPILNATIVYYKCTASYDMLPASSSQDLPPCWERQASFTLKLRLFRKQFVALLFTLVFLDT
jgi:hypothetical protein